MAAEEEQRKKESKGFAGLSSLVSDMDTAPPPAPRNESASAATTARRSVPQTTQSTHRPDQPKAYQEPSQASTRSSGSKWILGIAAIIGVLGLIGYFNKTTTSRVSTSPAQSTAASYSPPSQPQAPSRPTESKPPVGQNLVLSGEQISYCLAEDIRMDGAKSALNSYSDHDINRFNEMVADYNSRCGSFRYRNNALENARREIESYRSQLHTEGGGRFPHTSNGSLPVPMPSRPTPDATVHAIQRELNALGYKAGTADGLMGKGTRSAIIAFQQDRGLAVTGAADQALLLQLQRASAPVSTQPAASRSEGISVRLSPAEEASLEAVCSTDKYVNGPAAYRACTERQKAALAAGVGRPNLSALSPAEQQSIEAVCSTDKYANGPAAYNQCLVLQLAAMSRQGSGRPDLSRLSNPEQQSIEAVCSTDKYANGPAAYNQCLNTQLAALDRQGGGPDLSRLSAANRRMIESACSTEKYANGPAAYNRCLSQQLARLQ